METSALRANISNLTEFISEALASTTSSILGAAAAAAASAAAELPSSSGTTSSSSGSSSYFDYNQRISLLIPPRVLLSGTKRMVAKLDVTTCCALGGFIFVFCLYLIHLIASFYAKYRLHRKVLPNKTLPGVSVIKPLVGTEDVLKENLETFFTSKYHKFELLFCFHAKNDAAVLVVEELIKKYPKVEARMFFGGRKVGLNPKINNMMPAYDSAKYPLILISDSGISMREDAILDMAITMMSHEKMALVTQTPYCKDREGFGAAFEQVYFGTSHARIYLAGNCMEFVCSTGMSSMMKKEALDKCGGIEEFGGYLAEDYFFGRELANRGYKSAISTHPALQNGGNPSVYSFLDRVCRWVKLRIAMLPHIIVAEPLQDCFSSGIIMSMSLKYLMGFNPFVVFLLHVIYWFSMDYTLMHAMQNGDLCFSFPWFVLAWILRELSAPIVFLIALCQPTIRWRNNVFHLAWGGQIKPK